MITQHRIYFQNSRSLGALAQHSVDLVVTSPPYPIPLRGIEVTLRVQEYNTQQVRQASVVGDFLPE